MAVLLTLLVVAVLEIVAVAIVLAVVHSQPDRTHTRRDAWPLRRHAHH